MPIHDVGYRPWDGERTSQMSRWSIISLTGIRLAAKSRWVKRILFVAWLPVMYWGIGFFFIEKAIDSNGEGSQFSTPAIVPDDSIGNDPDNSPLADADLDPVDGDTVGGDAPLLNAEDFDQESVESAVDRVVADLIEKAKKVERQGKDGVSPELLKELADEQFELEMLAAQLVEKAKTKQASNVAAKTLKNQFGALPYVQEIADSLESGDSARIRNDVWRWLLMVFFRYPQAILILFLIGTIAPSLISRDLRSRAFLLYFSRPIGKLEYIFGKLCIPAAFMIAITTLPALALYVFAVLMSPSLSVVLNTWDIPLRIIAASFALVIPTASIALMLSSLTHESRYAGFSWFAVWVLGHGAYMAVFIATAMSMADQGSRNLQPADVMNSEIVKNWSCLSLYNCLGDAQALIFGFGTLADSWRGIVTLLMVTLFSLFILYRRVSAPIRV